jgi:hypothetical protein
MRGIRFIEATTLARRAQRRFPVPACDEKAFRVGTLENCCCLLRCPAVGYGVRCREVDASKDICLSCRHHHQSPAPCITGWSTDNRGFTHYAERSACPSWLGVVMYGVERSDSCREGEGSAVAVHIEQRPDHRVPRHEFISIGLTGTTPATWVSTLGDRKGGKAANDTFERPSRRIQTVRRRCDELGMVVGDGKECREGSENGKRQESHVNRRRS